MRADRRQALMLVPGAMALAALGGRAAFAAAAEMEAAIAAFTGGATPAAGRITLTAPEIAENGNSVPLGVSVDSAMTDADHVAAVLLLAPGNPITVVATFNFTPLSGKAEATTRIRLARTQNVVAVARMSDGTCFVDQREVRVTIGGCAG
jgi:sulfur-oxidizing protein SoxY